ncbi:hypothetical protein P3T36_004236 [Kitasatospora sp. MAP12-15]|uniref:hypothetical protein n=1 Tax=unclassified Kitasatospora TaxID=2633591 RepID=UPI00247426BD|nr:hypothetical protein [Kitasatospora sp. MAP12-44]MDH6108299.1 hypothetical protein [Kitasatospora sp. MAP12-44]
MRICDANGNNLSSPTIKLTSTQISGPVTKPFTAPFQYLPGAASEYLVTVNTQGLTSGNYNLQFTISGADTTTHVAPFVVR